MTPVVLGCRHDLNTTTQHMGEWLLIPYFMKKVARALRLQLMAVRWCNGRHPADDATVMGLLHM